MPFSPICMEESGEGWVDNGVESEFEGVVEADDGEGAPLSWRTGRDSDMASTALWLCCVYR